MHKPFLPCGPAPLGLYPIVDSMAWLQRLLPLGVKTIQLRIKNNPAPESEIQQAILLARQYETRLFINDYWELAMQYGAYGVHLGQEDLHTADLEKIQQAGLRLGVSTHSEAEIKRAEAITPSYIAFGPIFHTNTKQMSAAPQGVAQLAHWKNTLNYPLVAIGGITLENISEVLKTQVAGIACISAIIQAENPEETTQQLLTTVDRCSAQMK
jgi:hydroxymethylpyrimidine kinase/phosphomethylpyrimidine kinase/thiamine-phosphate diphosphorylase